MAKLQVKRGNKVNLPTLAPGELGLALDTNELFIGGSSGNVCLKSRTQANFLNGSDTFVNGTQYQVINPFITENTIVLVNPTSPKLGSWSVNSNIGGFVIVSDTIEKISVKFDWGAIK